MSFKLSIIGAGRLGGALAIALGRKGYPIVNVVSRSRQSADKLAAQIVLSAPATPPPHIFSIDDLAGFEFSPLVLIAAPDPEIEIIAQQLSRLAPPPETVFLHTSGALSSEVLRSLRAAGGEIGSLHPLVSVSDAALGAQQFAGAYFCLEGDAKAVAVAQKVVADLSGNFFSIATNQKPLYHAAAVMSAGHLVALFDLATETLGECGVEMEEARKILLPLVRSTVENLSHQTPAEALTGTFARADVETMRKHLAALAGNSAALNIYTELGLRSLKLAAERGTADAEKIALMRRELEDGKSNNI